MVSEDFLLQGVNDSIDLCAQIMMMFLVFSHYKHVTDAFYYHTCPSTAEPVHNLHYDLFTLAQAITSNVVVRRDYRYLLGHGTAYGGNCPAQLHHFWKLQIESILGLRESNKVN